MWRAFCLSLLLVATPTLAADGPLPDFASLVERNASSIVNITTEQPVTARSGSGNLDDLLRQLQPDEFRGPDEDEADQQEDEPARRRRGGVGSGFVISEDGYVVTNHHVVAAAERVIVTLNDNREFDATIVGSDELADMALLKIDASDLDPVRFGDSRSVRVGEWVLAIGSPFGLEFSAAVGIVSAKARSVPTRGTSNYVAFIQSDVAINQGNSGGPLFNLQGEVVGINAQILSSTGGSNGISFAIPSNMALNVIDQLRESGTVNRGLLGVMIKDVDKGLAEVFGLDRPRGAFVDEVQPDSPAEQAGVQDNDIIVGFNDIPIEWSSDLPYHVGQVRPGNEARLQIVRAGESMELPVTVGSLPGTELATVQLPEPRPWQGELALKVAGLDEASRPEGLEGGVVIERVRAGAARRAGLRAGDLIISLDHQAILNLDDYRDVVEGLPENGYVPVRILRGGRGTTLVMELR
ncbi:MAG: Do family serine endopeptidase [Pseudohongiellaceae bacterium]